MKKESNMLISRIFFFFELGGGGMWETVHNNLQLKKIPTKLLTKRESHQTVKRYTKESKDGC